MTKNPTTDQKVDLVLEKLTTLDTKATLIDKKVSVLDTKVTALQKNQNDLIKTVGEIAILAGKTADKLEEHAKQTDHEVKSGSFTPFTSGAFAA